MKKEKEKPERREPLLIDRFLHRRDPNHEKLIHPKTMEQLLRAARSAHRLVFDLEATERVAHVVMQVPDLLCREQQFARAPFDVCWVEFQPWKMLEIYKEYHPYNTHSIDSADETVAYLIDHNRVNTISAGSHDNPHRLPWVTPIQYHLHTEWPIEDQLKIARKSGISRSLLDQCMWGSTWDQLNDEQRRSLRSNHVIESVPISSHPRAREFTDRIFRDVLRMIGGDIRNLIALLLMLNRPSITKYTTKPAGRGFYRGKNLPYMSHSTVHVDLDAVETLRLIGTPRGEGVLRRRHEVKGHFCHDQTARDYQRIAGCVHQWLRCDATWTPAKEQHKPDPDADHWICSVCEGKRWWRADHMRGDATRGFVLRDGYEVHAP